MTHEWKVGEWYKTRGGYEAQVLDVNFNIVGGKPLLGKIKFDDREVPYTWKKDGSWSQAGTPSEYDLMPPVERKEFWVNVYNSHHGSNAWSSKELADKHAVYDRVYLLWIVIEGDDCTIEKVP